MQINAHAHACVQDGVLFFGTSDWFMYGVNVSTTPDPPTPQQPLPTINVKASPLRFNSRKEIVSAAAPAIGDGRIYFGNDAGVVFALRVPELTLLWSVGGSGGRRVSEPARLWRRACSAVHACGASVRCGACVRSAPPTACVCVKHTLS